MSLFDKNDRSLEFLKHLTLKTKIPELVHDHLWNQLKHYFILGGLPEVVKIYHENKNNLFEAFTLVRKKQGDLLHSYYADIAKHSGKVNAMHIDRVFKSVPAQISQAQDGSVARFKFRRIIPRITHYDRLAGAIDWLDAAWLTVKIPIVNTGHLPFKGYTKENFFKLYLFDVGILGSMRDLPPKVILDYEYGSYKGYFAENFVTQELVGQERTNLFGWQEARNELEFLTEVDGGAGNNIS